ncbi:MAG: DUF58 domain-containing protein [Clostridiales bacterium]|nr:DUF58 domain-containing protein [Clostridiales bacterium]
MKVSYLNDDFFGRLETLALNLRADLSGFFGGKHLVKTYGQTVEFADYREYQLGDDIRRVDWNLYSRFEKFFIKLFTDERQMHVQVFLDCSASMGKADPNKAAYATAVAAAFGFLAVHNMDKLSIHLVKGDRAENPFGTIVGKTSFFKAIRTLEETEFTGDCDLSSAIVGCQEVGNKDGITIIVSDFFSDNDFKKAIDYLAFKKRQVLLVQVLDEEEADPTFDGRYQLTDSEAVDVSDPKNMRIRITRSALKAYAKALAEYNAEIREYCASRGADFITLNTTQAIERVLFGELLKVGILE